MRFNIVAFPYISLNKEIFAILKWCWQPFPSLLRYITKKRIPRIQECNSKIVNFSGVFYLSIYITIHHNGTG